MRPCARPIQDAWHKLAQPAQHHAHKSASFYRNSAGPEMSKSLTRLFCSVARHSSVEHASMRPTDSKGRAQIGTKRHTTQEIGFVLSQPGGRGMSESLNPLFCP